MGYQWLQFFWRYCRECTWSCKQFLFSFCCSLFGVNSWRNSWILDLHFRNGFYYILWLLFMSHCQLRNKQLKNISEKYIMLHTMRKQKNHRAMRTGKYPPWGMENVRHEEWKMSGSASSAAGRKLFINIVRRKFCAFYVKSNLDVAKFCRTGNQKFSFAGNFYVWILLPGRKTLNISRCCKPLVLPEC